MQKYINTKTGEIIAADGKKEALRLFKADGKVVGYKVHFWNVKRFGRRKVK